MSWKRIGQSNTYEEDGAITVLGKHVLRGGD